MSTIQTATLTENRQRHGTEHLIGLLREDNGYEEPVEVVYCYDEETEHVVGAHTVIYLDGDGDYVFGRSGEDAGIYASLEVAVRAARSRLSRVAARAGGQAETL